MPDLYEDQRGQWWDVCYSPDEGDWYAVRYVDDLCLYHEDRAGVMRLIAKSPPP